MKHIPLPQILHIDLTAGRVRREPLTATARARDLGGRGLARALLDDTAHLAWDDPRAALCLCPGPLAGADLPGASHVVAAWASPLTGALADASCGGRLGAALARAGVAGIRITGRAKGPCGIAIRDQEVSLVQASALAGLPTDAVFAALSAFDGAAVIGPAAWAGSLLANLAVDRWWHGGRGGLGLALAAKNCAFVAATGHASVHVADPQGLSAARTAICRLIAASPALAGATGLGRFGPAALVDLAHGRRMMPTRNFRATHFPAAPRVNAPRLEAAYQAKGVACPGCPVACRRLAPGGVLLPDGDSLSHFTALLGLADAGLAMAGHNLCARLGLDPVSAAATLACQAELTGQEPTPEAVPGLLADMAAMRGPGRELGQGAAAYAAAKGRPETAMAVKSLELPAWDPRGAYGLALALAVSTIGADAWRAGCLAHEILRKPVATDRFTFDGKARAVVLGENARAAADSLAVCPWLCLGVSLEEWAHGLSAITGEPVAAGDLARLGARVVYRERMQNSRRGFAAAHDDLPARFFTEPGSGGDGIRVPPLPREAFLAARAKYYRIRGLDENGRSTPERARELDLSWTP